MRDLDQRSQDVMRNIDQVTNIESVAFLCEMGIFFNIISQDEEQLWFSISMIYSINFGKSEIKDSYKYYEVYAYIYIFYIFIIWYEVLFP